jgi:BolA protein
MTNSPAPLSSGTSRYERMMAQLQTSLLPTVLTIVDDSHHHAGHNAIAASQGETHFSITIASPLFAEKTRIACHRLVQDVLKDEFATGLHALQIQVIKIEP